MTNEEKARVLSNKGCLGAYISKDAEALNPTEEDKKRLSIYGACLEAMQWKDEQWERLVAESKSIGVDLLQCKDEQFAQEKQQLIDEACEWLAKNDSYAIPTNVQVDRLREYLNNIK